MPDIDFNFTWDWTQFCPTGLKPFANDTNDLLPCFQEIALQFPIYTIFTAISAYNFGSHVRPITRNARQLRLLEIRVLITIILTLLPILKIFTFHHVGMLLYAVDVLLVSTQCIMWAVHCGYLLSMRYYGEISHRGSLLMNVIWLAIVVLDGVWLRTSRHFDWWTWSLVTMICDLLYGLTLLPKGNARVAATPTTTTSTSTTINSEEEALLSDRYTYFTFDLNESHHLGHAQDEANWASRFVFYWVHPLISKGVAGKLKRVEDLFDLPDALNITRLSERLQQALSHSHSLWRALHKSFGLEFYLIGLLRFVADVSSFAGPLLLGELLRQGKDTSSSDKAYLLALGLFGSTLVSAFCSTHFDWRMAMVSMKMRVGVVSAIYRKALEAQGNARDAQPDMLNLMSTDTDRIVNSCISFHFFWSIPFKLFTTLYLLYTQLGAAFIAGVIFAAMLIPINRWLAKRIGVYSTGLMKAKDARLSATTETIQGAKQIKTNAWEDIFIGKIKTLRAEEVKFMSKRKYLDAMCVYFWATTPVLMCLLTFGVSVLLGNPLVAATTYTSVALLNMLIGPLNAFPWVLNGLIEAWVSLRRVQQLIDVPNLDLSSYYNPIICGESTDLSKPTVLQLKCANFIHNQSSTQGAPIEHFRLRDINVDVKAGELICIEGPVGGGKSSLIDAICAGLQCIDGEVCVQDLTTGFGYVPQSPWLQRATIRDNIIWGAGYDEKWYRTVLHACALNEDIAALGGDLQGVGENGRTLSGGQRARVALARAVYQDKKVYLLDDVLSALDAHVAKHIIKYCLLGVLKTKTRIVVTRNTQLFFHANQILTMHDGHLEPSTYMTGSTDISLDYNDEIDLLPTTTTTTTTISNKEQQDNQSVDSLLIEESREYGHLSGNVFSCYWNAVGTKLALVVVFFVLLMQLTRNLSDAWLANWVTATTLDPVNPPNETASLSHQLGSNSNNDSHTTGFYLSIYASIAITNSLATLVRAFLFAYAGIKAAIFIHEKLLRKVMFSKFSFFDVTSVGRIMNRFSSDTNTIDDSLPFIVNILLAQLVGLLGALAISLYAMPWLGLIVIPMVPIYLNLQQRYRYASRDIKRLSSNAMSPLYTHFTETLQGLATIRSMRASARFQRDFHDKLEESIKSTLTSSAATQWLALRLQLLGTLLVGGAGLLAAITASHTTNPGLVGLCISYALSITGQLADLLYAVAETEQELVAVERVDQYLQLEGEPNADGCADAPFGWPTQGVLSYTDVELSYREHITPALHRINFETEAFERIGIVGRTGAGKSSVVAALLRIAPLSYGEIKLDHVNLKTLPLNVLRQRIGCITQEPFLFEGNVRENLDPRHSHYDSEIWHAIQNSSAATLLVQQLGGLDGRVEKAGNNLSAGQRQLLCLARALLKNAKVVCIDEGTSNLDDESDLNMQQALRNVFKSCTLLFIAHRLRGLHTMDRIIVLDNGEICEIGKPQELALNTNSIFHSMLLAQKITIDEFTKATD